MTYRTAYELLQLISFYFVGKMLLLTRTTETKITMLKVLDNKKGIPIIEGSSFNLEEVF